VGVKTQSSMQYSLTCTFRFPVTNRIAAIWLP